MTWFPLMKHFYLGFGKHNSPLLFLQGIIIFLIQNMVISSFSCENYPSWDHCDNDRRTKKTLVRESILNVAEKHVMKLPLEDNITNGCVTLEWLWVILDHESLAGPGLLWSDIDWPYYTRLSMLWVIHKTGFTLCWSDQVNIIRSSSLSQPPCCLLVNILSTITKRTNM